MTSGRLEALFWTVPGYKGFMGAIHVKGVAGDILGGQDWVFNQKV